MSGKKDKDENVTLNTNFWTTIFNVCTCLLVKLFFFLTSHAANRKAETACINLLPTASCQCLSISSASVLPSVCVSFHAASVLSARRPVTCP